MLVISCGILRKDDCYLIAQRIKTETHFPLKWEFPGGKKRQDESGEECIIRELEEELGIQVKVKTLYNRSEKEDATFLHYCVEWVSGEISLVDHEQVKWVPAGDLKNYDLLDVDLEIATMLEESTET